ncbi:MAG TPA: ISAzo13 family transposase [Thermoleophilaceae bacterium]|nr:ISAzo13 family transposase [Thermoleophilaceae bacterium]
MIDEVVIGDKYRLLAGGLDERGMRRWAAAEALSLGRGGTAAVARATGIAESTIRRGRRELACEERPEAGRVRRRGAGRKPLTETDPTLLADLERLVDDTSRGDPEAPLRWTAKSLRNLATELRGQGHEISAASVAPLLRRLGYSLQANAKTREGAKHPDRDAQFAHINETVATALKQGRPVISVDTKKKELIGDFKNGGRELRPKGEPEQVRTHDFKDKALGKVNPYGVYDVAEDAGWVSVGIDSDTAQFAVASIRGWWRHLGHERYPDATSLTITADCGGSNGNRTRLWKTELQALADDTGLEIRVCHLPPGTSKWNKIEHRLFSFISMNWRAKPLISRQVVIDLINATTTRTGLEVFARLDEHTYPKGIKVSNAELAAVNLKPNAFHPEWNYTIKPSGN